MDFYIFDTNGNYIGMRGIAPTESDLVGVEANPENVDKMTKFVKPILQKNVIIESATNQEIADFNKSQVPQTASKMRFFLSLLNIGITRAMVYEVINQISDATLKEIVLIKFDLSQEFDRQDEHLIMLANQFEISETELDNLFIEANE